MYQTAKPLFLVCQTGLHAGSGADLGIVDLPIQRERHTSFPKIEGSSLKGALREAVEHHVNSQNFKGFDDDDVKIHRIFGYDDSSLNETKTDDLQRVFQKGEEVKKDFAGAIGFTDARLLLFPVKSLKGVFAWITCNKVLRQFASDMHLCEGVTLPKLPEENTIGKNNSLFVSGKKVILEEYTLEVEEDDKVNELGEWLADHLFEGKNSYWANKVKKDIIVLSDDDFTDFVNLSTEVITRTKIDNNTGTVASGALFTEEYLPAESIMYALVLAHQEFRSNSDLTAQKILDFFNDNLREVIQIGGNATLGKGLVQTTFLHSSSQN